MYQEHSHATSAEAAATIARAALPLASQHQLPITPITYAVLYDYVSKSNQPLFEEASRIIAKNKRLSIAAVNDLYRRFVAKKDEQELLELRDELMVILATTLTSLKEVGSHNERYQVDLGQTIDRLDDQSCAVEDLRQILLSLRTETVRILDTEKTLSERLEHAHGEIESLRQDCVRARSESLIDPLTSTLNRRGFEQKLTELCHAKRAEECKVALLMLDIDHFKRVNDQFGHLIGDEVIKYVASIIKETVRGADVVSRFGGEEFAVLLPDTSQVGAMQAAHNIRQRISATSLRQKSTGLQIGVITVSIGVSKFVVGMTQEAFINAADKALYQAKNSGRNGVSCALHEDSCVECLHAPSSEMACLKAG